MPARVPRDEQETVIRYDPVDQFWHLFTSRPAMARQWARLGYAVTPTAWTEDGPIAWRTTAPPQSIHLRRLINGAPAKRTWPSTVDHGRRRLKFT